MVVFCFFCKSAGGKLNLTWGHPVCRTSRKKTTLWPPPTAFIEGKLSRLSNLQQHSKADNPENLVALHMYIQNKYFACNQYAPCIVGTCGTISWWSYLTIPFSMWPVDRHLFNKAGKQLPVNSRFKTAARKTCSDRFDSSLNIITLKVEQHKGNCYNRWNNWYPCICFGKNNSSVVEFKHFDNMRDHIRPYLIFSFFFFLVNMPFSPFLKRN